MAKIELRLSTLESDGMSELLIRFSISRNVVLRAKGGIMVERSFWDEKKRCIKISSANQGDMMSRLSRQHDIDTLCSSIMQAYAKSNSDIDKSWLEDVIWKHHHPEVQEVKRPTKLDFEGIFSEFLNTRCLELSESRKSRYRYLKGMVERFEAFSGRKPEVKSMTSQWISEFETYLRNEHAIANDERYDFMFKGLHIRPRSQNLLDNVLGSLRSFLHWCLMQDYISSNPFDKFKLHSGVYGTPYYLTLEERDKLYNWKLDFNKTLETQRDIFIFQCCIGCRVSDLERMTPANVVDGAVEYVPRKTKDGRSMLVRVPLNALASEILCKYSDDGKRKRLFPFISTQKYNNAIKECFTLAGLRRKVSILDPITRLEVQKPLNEVASSHLARRTFIGNLYRQVQDPNLIGALSGHTEGSKAFARYHDIDEGMKRKLVALLDTKPVEAPEEKSKKNPKNFRKGVLN